MNSVFTFPAAFSPAECDAIIALAHEGDLNDAGLTKGQTDYSYRRADLAWLDERQGTDWVMGRIIDVVAQANRSHFDYALTEFGESPQVARYGAERKGHFVWHSDIGDGAFAMKRKLTLVVQLSDPLDYTGGVLEIWPSSQTQTAELARGTATLFPSFVLHRVTPVTRGERYSLTTWAHGPAFR